MTLLVAIGRQVVRSQRVGDDADDVHVLVLLVFMSYIQNKMFAFLVSRITCQGRLCDVARVPTTFRIRATIKWIPTNPYKRALW